MNKKSIDGTKVNKQRCKTCPFNNPNSDWSKEVITRIRSCIFTESNHICHSTNNSICRGSRNEQLIYFHRIGLLNQPTDECWNQTLGEIRQNGK